MSNEETEVWRREHLADEGGGVETLFVRRSACFSLFISQDQLSLRENNPRRTRVTVIFDAIVPSKWKAQSLRRTVRKSILYNECRRERQLFSIFHSYTVEASPLIPSEDRSPRPL